MGLGSIGTGLHAAMGKTASYKPADGSAAVATTARVKAAATQATRSPRQVRSTTTADLFLLASAVAAQPRKGATITLSHGDTWDGTYTLAVDAEATESGEWRCPVIRDAVNHTMAEAGGSPRRRII